MRNAVNNQNYLFFGIAGSLLSALAIISLFANTPVQVVEIIGGLLFLLGLPWYVKYPHWVLYITICVIPLGILTVVVPGMTAVPLLGAFLFF